MCELVAVGNYRLVRAQGSGLLWPPNHEQDIIEQSAGGCLFSHVFERAGSELDAAADRQGAV